MLKVDKLSESRHLQFYEIAKIQLETAIKLYDEQNYISSITLAKAAEEFLGKQLGNYSTHAQLKLKIQKIEPSLERHLNRIANFLKHGNDYDLCENDIDIKMESIQYIARAISNYLTYTNGISPLMLSFSNKHVMPLIEEEASNK